ncbi:MAG: NUDIX hydrolase, partial [Candidatus Levyibacteriota bacterium]
MITCFFENNNKALLRHVVVDVLVLKDEKLLLVKRTKKLLEGGKWGLVGGFVERDENLQEAVAREIFEETGYKVKDITLLTIRHNADRPHEDRQNISFVFFCIALEKEGTA